MLSEHTLSCSGNVLTVCIHHGSAAFQEVKLTNLKMRPATSKAATPCARQEGWAILRTTKKQRVVIHGVSRRFELGTSKLCAALTIQTSCVSVLAVRRATTSR